jgi:hypothetical protein
VVDACISFPALVGSENQIGNHHLAGLTSDYIQSDFKMHVGVGVLVVLRVWRVNNTLYYLIYGYHDMTPKTVVYTVSQGGFHQLNQFLCC